MTDSNDAAVLQHRAAIIESLQPLFHRATAEGLLFHALGFGLYLTPAELIEQHGRGRYLWGPDNWELVSPAGIRTNTGVGVRVGEAVIGYIITAEENANFQSACKFLGIDSTDNMVEAIQRMVDDATAALAPPAISRGHDYSPFSRFIDPEQLFHGYYIPGLEPEFSANFQEILTTKPALSIEAAVFAACALAAHDRQDK